MTFAWLSAGELRAGFLARTFSPVEVLAELSERIEGLDPALNAFVTRTLETAARNAASAERAYAAGDPERPLLGVPFAAKDLFDTAGIRTTYGSAIFAAHVPAEDADAVARMRRAGAILVGKTSTHEFGWGITCANPHFGATHNPWASGRIAGGSSGGSAAALAAGLVPVALGTDTGGSIRIPAGFCGVAGLKPTYGRVSTNGALPLAPSFDHAGPMARTPADLELVLDVLAPPSGAEPPRTGTLRVAVCPDLHRVPLATDVEDVFTRALETLAGLGADVVETALPEAEAAYETFAAIQLAEALHVHRARGLYPGRRDEYGPDVRGRLELAEGVGLDDYLAALDRRRALARGFDRMFGEADLLLTPAAPITSPPLGGDTVRHGGREMTLREVVMTYTTPQNLLGLPACALRAGFGADALPVGVQLTGPPGSEARVLRAACLLFEATPAVQQRQPDATR